MSLVGIDDNSSLCQGSSLLHAQQPKSTIVVTCPHGFVWVKAATIILNPHPHRRRAERDRELDVLGVRMIGNIVDGFLNDSKQGNFQFRCKAAGRSLR